jgi:hypothetical protein
MPGATAPGMRFAPDGAAAGPADAGGSAEAAWRRADTGYMPPGTAGFGRISRSFVATALVAVAAIAVVVLGWRLAWREHEAIPTETSLVGTSPVETSQVETSLDETSPSETSPSETGPTEATADAVAADAAPSDAGFDAAVDANLRTSQASVEGRDDVRTGMRMSATRSIAAGMDRDTVRDILGEPLDMQALRWEYGPSWVDFDCDRVVDWYSSPLRPLPVARTRAPQADTHDAADRGCH